MFSYLSSDARYTVFLLTFLIGVKTLNSAQPQASTVAAKTRPQKTNYCINNTSEVSFAGVTPAEV